MRRVRAAILVEDREDDMTTREIWDVWMIGGRRSEEMD